MRSTMLGFILFACLCQSVQSKPLRASVQSANRQSTGTSVDIPPQRQALPGQQTKSPEHTEFLKLRTKLMANSCVKAIFKGAVPCRQYQEHRVWAKKLREENDPALKQEMVAKHAAHIKELNDRPPEVVKKEKSDVFFWIKMMWTEYCKPAPQDVSVCNTPSMKKAYDSTR